MSTVYDIAVVGAGAAGLTAAQYGARANLRTVVLEQAVTGGQCLEIESLENYPGFPDAINGFDFTELLERQAKQFGAEFVNATVTRFDKDGDLFRIETSSGQMESRTVILATGAQHRSLGVPGEAELAGRGVSYCATCDGPFFRDRPILVVGGGDAACDEATFLSKLSDRVTIIHRRERFRAQPAVAQRVIDNDRITVRFNTVLTEIHGERTATGMEKVASVSLRNTVTGDNERAVVDAVFVFVGSDPHTELVPTLPKDEAGYLVTDEKMETAVAGLFAAGDVRSSPFRQLVVAAGEGAIAAHSATRHIEALEDRVYQPYGS